MFRSFSKRSIQTVYLLYLICLIRNVPLHYIALILPVNLHSSIPKETDLTLSKNKVTAIKESLAVTKMDVSFCRQLDHVSMRYHYF